MKNKNIGIITLYDNYNYGNKLQNYALQEVLKKLGHTTETIVNNDKKSKQIVANMYEMYGMSKALKAIVKNSLRSIGLGNILKKPQSKEQKKLEKERVENIKIFDKLISTNEMRPYNKNLKAIDEKYDFFVMGSDQIWNPFFLFNYKFDLGLFTSKDKKMSYAASIAVPSISEIEKKVYIEALEDMQENRISVREFQGEEIVKNLTGKNAQTVLDPTMLLDKEEWSALTKEPKIKPEKKFILTYILGDTSQERRSFINEVAKKYDADVINFLDITQPEVYTAGVDEFLWYFENADMVFADSFHAGVFAIIFGKPFYILDRAGGVINMNTRFDTLLTTFEIKEKFLDEYNIDLVNKDIDYKKINKILERRKEESLDFLKTALEN